MQLDFLHKGRSADYKLMTDILYYMTQYTDIIHHPMEEVIFSLLTEREIGLEKNVTELTKQHQMVGDSGSFLNGKLENIINDKSEIKELQEIKMLGRLYSSALHTHMDKEEQGLFISAEKLLNDNDWENIKSVTQTKPDPIFGKAIEARFHLVCNQLTVC